MSNGEVYFVTSATAERTPFFRYERWCQLFLDELYGYRKNAFHLHEFVLMSDHFHLLIAPSESLERAVQLIKGGFARRASLQFETKQTIWQRGFTDHRIRDATDYEKHKQYIWMNPVKARLCASTSKYQYSSASGRYELDPIPQGLKPPSSAGIGGTAKAVPFPKPNDVGGAEAPPLQPQGPKPLGREIMSGTAEAVRLQRLDLFRDQISENFEAGATPARNY